LRDVNIGKKRRKGKPGPQEERLIIKGDPEKAIAKLLGIKPGKNLRRFVGIDYPLPRVSNE